MGLLGRSHILQQIISRNAADVAAAFRVDTVPVLGDAVTALAEWPTSRISHLVLQYDRQVAAHGFAQASRWLLEAIEQQVAVHSAGPLPTSGPLLVAGNHPGMTDMMAMLSVLPRDDIRILAAERPVLLLLENIRERLILIPDHKGDRARMGAVRTAARHLHEGGTLLTFPAGKIEPDPARRATALRSLDDWSRSLDLFARLVPDLQTVPMAASHVISEDALRNPLVQLYRTEARRDWVAATLMVLFAPYRRVRVQLQVGQVIQAAQLGQSDSLTEMIRAQMRSFYGRAFSMKM